MNNCGNSFADVEKEEMKIKLNIFYYSKAFNHKKYYALSKERTKYLSFKLGEHMC